jgi:hypothetical protein
VWTSLGGDLKPSIDLVITMALQPDRLSEIAQAVMAPMRLKAVGQVTYEAEDDIRHLPDPSGADAVPISVVGGRTRKSTGKPGS